MWSASVARGPQFTLRTLLWLTALVAAFCGGMRLERQRIENDAARVAGDKRWRIPGVRRRSDGRFVHLVIQPDGTGVDEEIPPIP
jgi:hypothetical protein